MNLIIDTHVFLWLMQTPEKLSHKALNVCEDLNNSLKDPEHEQLENEIDQIKLPYKLKIKKTRR